MRAAIFAVLIATPAVGQETGLLDHDCMDALAAAGYGPETFETGIIAGTLLGYAVAVGYTEAEANEAGRKVGAICRETPGMTFGEALATLSPRSR